MAENLEKPVPSHTQLNTAADYTQALNTLIGLAQRRLRIFDHNLEDGGYNTLQRYELLRSFLLASRGNRLEIVLHDSDYLSRYCPRILNLLKQFSHAVSIMETTSQAKNVFDPFVIADEACHLHRFHYDAPRALLALNDIEASHALIKRFDEIIAASIPSIAATTLGL